MFVQKKCYSAVTVKECYGAVLVRGSKGHGGHCLHLIVIRGHCPPLPPSPLFCMMYKSINGGGSGGGGGSAIHHPKISESGPQPIDTFICTPHL